MYITRIEFNATFLLRVFSKFVAIMTVIPVVAYIKNRPAAGTPPHEVYKSSQPREQDVYETSHYRVSAISLSVQLFRRSFARKTSVVIVVQPEHRNK